MSVVKFRPYKKLSDKQLLDEAYKKMKKLQQLEREKKEELYKEEVMKLNEMIIEIKKRNLKIDNRTLLRRILLN
ncbi:hypothetical protein [Thermohalobacter berrensis]|uniref:Uncharacterized protein n=1 Tax=Thermohalobacter berrensis TaxID=99594 RepID=A0A419T2X0_9FIRM|nr:hypothetical protein [Thermohalobacter berrensis]RKD31801.1 hypothetical protein BET03_12025 [Thermohalobacter berrensis]